jgi:ribA/ribD-fused uncharacterized protein
MKPHFDTELAVPPYAKHNEYEIRGFFGDYRFMSNFYSCKLPFWGVTYNSSENAYQAAKVIPEERIKLVDVTAGQSKKVWKTLQRIDYPDWDAVKFDIMAEIVFLKFLHNKDLRQKLLDTAKKYLEESNHWNDRDWGVCNNVGKNYLGKILMKVRDFWV